MLRKNCGQSTLEYAILIAVVAAALLAIQTYMKRGVQGKLRSSTDSIGEQYSAGCITSKFTTQQQGSLVTKEEFGTAAAGGAGVSKYNVTTAANITRRAKDADKEQIMRNLSQEDLFE